MTPFQSHRGLMLFVAVVATCASTSLAGEVTFRRTSLTTVAETNMGDVPVAEAFAAVARLRTTGPRDHAD